jgi:hypothetical protein
VVALLLGALAITIVDRWRKRQNPDRLRPEDQLSQFQALYDRGELSDEEFRRIRGLLTEQVIREKETAAGVAAQDSPADGSVNRKLEQVLKEIRISDRPPQTPPPESSAAPEQPPST